LHPTIGSVPAYPTFVVLAIVVGMAATVVCAKRARLPIAQFFMAHTFVVVAAVIGAKLYSMYEQGSVFPGSAISLAGFRYPGGILAVLVALALVPLHRGCEGFTGHAAASIAGWSHVG
jgi:prolipoprotein diacylglyceryltransferase